MAGLARRPGGLGGSKSGSSKSSSGSSSSSKYRKPVDIGGKDGGAASGGKTLPSWPLSKLSSRAVTYAKPQRTTKLLEGTPCYLSGCPSWIKAPTLWAPRLSPKVVSTSTLGFGRHGSQVLQVRQLSQGHCAVMKQFVRDKLVASPRLHDKVLNEWQVHSALVPHPNVVPLYGAVEDKSFVTLIMEMQRGDLLSYLDEQDREVLSEDEARAVAADVLAALVHMHEMGFVHRDLKPENVFLAPPRLSAAVGAVGGRGRRAGTGAGGGGGGGGGCTWRLGDLGSAVELDRVMQLGAPGLHLEGSPPFLAPEYAALWVAPPAARTAQLMQAATSPKQDIWGLGALLYDMLVGHPPFSGPAAVAAATASGGSGSGSGSAEDIPMPQLAAAIMHQPPSPSPAEAGLSPAAVDFLSAALRKAPGERPSAAELLDHPWLAADGGIGR